MRWDEYDGYLFDIDGTLLRSDDAVHYFAFCEGLSVVAGKQLNLDGVLAHGNTDVGILRDAWQLAGVGSEIWRPRLAETRDFMCSFVEARRDDLRISVLPGVCEVLDYLKSRGAVLGVATGNLERIARVKLQRVRLLERFDFSGYSDDFEYRRDVFGLALKLARERAGENARVCVVGDTPEDVRSARANGLDCIAVATGIYSFETLRAESPDWCLHSLMELLVNEDS